VGAAVAAGLAAAAALAAVPPAPTPATGAPPWPAPANPMQRTRMAGLVPETHEFLAYHVHAHLDILVNGRKVWIPAGIGIDIHNPSVQHGNDGTGVHGTSYGGIDMCAAPCISPLHTHDWSGVLHTESKRSTPNRLGQFFTEWKVRLDRQCVGGYCKPAAPISVYVDGKRTTGNPRDIELTNLREIAIVIGTPPSHIPSRFPTG